MRKTMLKMALVFVTLATLFGCATKSAFVYERPEIKGGATTGRVLLCKGTQDTRQERSLDTVYEGDTLEHVRQIIEQEMMSTGLFEKVVWTKTEAGSEDGYKASGNRFSLDTALNDLRWEVPGYDALQTKAFIAGLATGLVGGLVYGATSTDVNGASKVSARLVDLSAGKALVDKEYVGSFKTTKAKMSCDTSETKAEVAGKALKDAMEQLKADVTKALTSATASPEPPPEKQ
jgi:hypothetical protein